MAITKSVSCIIVNYKTSDEIMELTSKLDDLFDKVLIVDNSNDFPTSDRLDVIRPNENLGYGSAVNFAIGHIESPYVLVMNPDIEIDAIEIKSFLNAATQRDDISIALPQPSIGDYVIEYSKKNSTLEKSTFSKEMTDRASDDYCLFTGFSFVLFSVSNFRLIGGFEPRFFMYAEDIDFVVRTVDLLGGGGVTKVPVKYRHASGGSYKSYWARIMRFFHSFRSHLLFFKIHPHLCRGKSRYLLALKFTVPKYFFKSST